MQTMFSPALVACIAQGRAPLSYELDDLANTVQHQSFGARPAQTARLLAQLAADIAFNGVRTFV